MNTVCRCLYKHISSKNRWYLRYGLLLFFTLYLSTFIYRNPLKPNLPVSNIFFQVPIVPFHRNDFRLYPESHSFVEYERIRIDNDIQSIYSSNKDEEKETVLYTKALKYSESMFRSATTPIIWLDAYGDVRWNQRAESETLDYLFKKQFPSDLSKSDPTTIINNCLSRPIFLLDQWPWGFFSRFHCFIKQFGQTLYSPLMVLLIPKRFMVSQSSQDDFLNEGIIRYFQPFSICAAYFNHPQMKSNQHIFDKIHAAAPSNIKHISNINQLLERNEQTVQYLYSTEIWKFGYDHVPHRRWLFDRNRTEIKKRLHYNSSIKLLIDHSNEHIYHYDGSLLNLTSWLPRNSPQSLPKDVLPGTSTNLTVHDHIFSSFLRYMFTRFFSSFTPRIQSLAKLLADHWAEYLSEKNNQSYETSLSNLAVLFIRRGDKMPEDSFWQKHQHWRNISMYVKGLVDEEKRRSINYSSIFIMTDDRNVMSSIEEYSRNGLTNANQDEKYARKHLYKRQILYNIFARQACFDPFIRIGFEQFLVNILFILHHASLVIGHTDSNVGRYLEEIIYIHRQHQPNIQTTTYIRNAPDTLD